MTLKLEMLATLDAKGVSAGADRSRREIKSIETATKGATNAARAQGAATTKAGLASAKSTALARHEMTNLSFQMNDIAMGLASGQQSPFTIMIQQGAQVSQIMGSRGLGQILPAIGASFLSLLSPTTFFFAAITAGGYAASAVFSALQGDVVDIDELLKTHETTIRDLDDAWSKSADGAFKYSEEVRKVAQNQALLEQGKLAEQLPGQILSGVQDGFVSIKSISRDFYDSEEGSEFLEFLKQFRIEVRAGGGDVHEFSNQLEAMNKATDDEDIKQYTRAIFDMLEEARKTAKQLKLGENAIIDFGGAAKQAASDVEKFERSLSRLANGERERSARDKALTDFDTTLGSAKHLGDALRAREAYMDRLQRIANKEAGVGMPTPTDRPNDFEREKPLKKRSTRISKEARELKRRQEHAERWLRTKGEQIALQELELTLIGKTGAARQQAKAMLAAEQEIHRRRIDLHGDEARAIRNSASALASVTSELARQKKAWNEVKSAGTGAVDTIMDAVISGDWEGALKSISTDISKSLLSLSAGNPIKNQLYGTDLPTLDDTGGVAGFFKSLLGAGPAGSASTGQMQVTAASVIVNGGGINDTLKTFGTGIAKSTDALAKGNDSLAGTAETFSDQTDSLAGRFTSGLNKVLSSIANAGKPNTGSGILGSISKAILGGSSTVASASAAASPGLSTLIASGVGGLFDKGGATPSGSDSDIAGIVHANEFVFDAPSTRRIGVGTLEAIRKGALKGYREGGFVSPGGNAGHCNAVPASGNFQLIVNNHSQAEISDVKQEDDGKGGRRAILELQDVVAAGISQQGSPISNALKTTGVRQPMIVR